MSPMTILQRVRSLLAARRQEDFRKQFPHVAFGEGVILRGGNRFFPGAGCSVDVRAYLNCAGGAWNDFSGYIKTGDNCEIGAYCVLYGAGGITLGSNVHMGAHVTISANQLRRAASSQDKPEDTLEMQFAPVSIEDYVLIASNVAIAPGVTIGRHSFIAPGSAVVKDIPPNSVASGSPARVFMSSTPRAEQSTSP